MRLLCNRWLGRPRKRKQYLHLPAANDPAAVANCCTLSSVQRSQRRGRVDSRSLVRDLPCAQTPDLSGLALGTETAYARDPQCERAVCPFLVAPKRSQWLPPLLLARVRALMQTWWLRFGNRTRPEQRLPRLRVSPRALGAILHSELRLVESPRTQCHVAAGCDSIVRRVGRGAPAILLPLQRRLPFWLALFRHIPSEPQTARARFRRRMVPCAASICTPLAGSGKSSSTALALLHRDGLFDAFDFDGRGDRLGSGEQTFDFGRW